MSASRTITSPGYPTFTVTKLMFPTSEGRLKMQTVVEVDGVELTINDLKKMLIEAQHFDAEWRGALGLDTSGLKRIGRT